ncbi:Family of serine hydrolases 3 [Collariella sp. IMI 366227]|nr:Family of serine hydrolases 3 [Collariella sp. IMI 366227]
MGDSLTSLPPSRTDSPATGAASPSASAPATASASPSASASTSGVSTPKGPAKKEVKILMLHGYTQSGSMFRAKTRAVEKLLVKALAPAGLVPALFYPTGPTRLRVEDIPGYEPTETTPTEIESWAWFRKHDATNTYRGLVEAIGEARKGSEGGEEGGFVDGVVGFSQGGCMAAILAAAMEGSHQPTEECEEWVKAVREANGGRPLRFAVSYSGFYATPDDLTWLYRPKIATPTLHILGGQDTVVDEDRSQGLIERCENPAVVTHPGGHHVPVARQWVMPVAAFIHKCMAEGDQGKL